MIPDPPTAHEAARIFAKIGASQVEPTNLDVYEATIKAEADPLDPALSPPKVIK